MGRAEFGTPIFASGSVAAVGLVGILRTGGRQVIAAQNAAVVRVKNLFILNQFVRYECMLMNVLQSQAIALTFTN